MKHLLPIYFLACTIPAFSQTKTGSDSLQAKVISFAFNKADSSLSWTVDKATASNKDTFFIQQFRWSTWKYLDTFQLKTNETTYKYQPYVHGGKNQYRIICGKNKPRIAAFCCGEEANFDGVCHLGADPRLTKVVIWEILNEYGKVIRSGKSNVIPTTGLPKGVYYLNYDNKMGEFIKK